MNYKNARFLLSCATLKQCPAPSKPEIAVVGRSNVGKSSLLNHLFQKKGLVKTSATPGKTRLLNFFSVDDSVLFVDLPGYGYAKCSVSIRASWAKSVDAYLQERRSLKLILFLLDSRRAPSEDDMAFLEWLKFHNKPFLVVLTKMDKIPKTQRKSCQDKVLKTLELDNIQLLTYSVSKNIGRRELIAAIGQMIG